jgi:hypothetical protein
MSFNWGSLSTPTTASTPTLSFNTGSTGAATSAAPVGALFQTPAAGTGTSTGVEQPKQLTWSTQFEDLPPVMQQDLTKIQYLPLHPSASLCPFRPSTALICSFLLLPRKDKDLGGEDEK